MANPAHREAKAEMFFALSDSDATAQPVTRINSHDLFRQMREVEIAHEGRIYRLRLTQLNKLILTA